MAVALDFYLANVKENAYDRVGNPVEFVVDGTPFTIPAGEHYHRVYPTEVGEHSIEIRLPSGWVFDRWEPFIVEGWTMAEIDNPRSPSTMITTTGPAMIRAWVTPAPPVEINLPMIGGIAVAVVDAALIVYYIATHISSVRK